MSIPPSQTERIDPWRVRVKAGPGMRRDGMVYANKRLFKQIQKDGTLDQVANVAALPGLVGHSLAMPDAHQGYGFPIGGVAATDPANGGVVSPGGVGFDINCGVRLLATDLSEKEVRKRIEDLLDEVFHRVPVGFGRNSETGPEIPRILAEGSRHLVTLGLATDADLAHTEEGGCHPQADPSKVSDRAIARGREQLGTLGSGNHFVEIQAVSKVHDEDVAARFGLYEGQIVVLVHSGSRGLGHQVCQDYTGRFVDAMKRYDISMPDAQLACAPVDSPEGRDYLGAMGAAANYAWANRQTITARVRDSLEAVFGTSEARLVYDVGHNLAKMEEHEVDGHVCTLCVHRKGAIRAFAAGRPELPEDYRDIGQPVFIPGSMGTSSWVLVGTERAMKETFGSVCHGAGREMSRGEAKKKVRSDEVIRDLKKLGISIRAGSKAGIAEEYPGAYKDVSEVVETVEGAGLARVVAKLVPIGVVKG